MACVTPRQVSNILSPLLSPTAPKTSPALPRNRESYRSLLASYSSYTWYGKPLPLSPLQCSKWGWKCVAKDTLECSICKAKLFFVCAVPPWQFDQYNKICREFGIAVQTSHEGICPWANKPYSDDMLFGGKISLSYDKSEFVSTFHFLNQTLETDKIPEIEVPGSILKRLWPVLPTIMKLLNRDKDSTELVRNGNLNMDVKYVTCLLLSLFGWRRYDQDLPTLHCKLCLRTLGLWNFKTLSCDTASIVVESESIPELWTTEPDRHFSLHQTTEDSLTPLDTDTESRSRLSSSNCSDTSTSLTKPSESDEVESVATSREKTPEIPPSREKTPEMPSPGKTPEISSPGKTPEMSSPGKTPEISSPGKTPEISSPGKTPDTPHTPNDMSDNCSSETLVFAFDPEKSPKTEDGNSPKNGKMSEENNKSPIDRDGFKSPEPTTSRSTRSLRSRSKAKSAEQASPTRKTPQQRKRKSKTAESPTTPTMTTRTRSGKTPVMSPLLQPMRKRRRSKVEVMESFITEFMKSSPPVLTLTSVNHSKLHVVNEHHHWCPWVSTLPAYSIPKAYRNTPHKLQQEGHRSVHTVEQCDERGWETLLFHLTTVKSPENAWLAVHNMLQDCVSHRK